MAERILPEASLRPNASPVDRFAAPRMQEAAPSGMASLADSLSRINPEINKFLGSMSEQKAQEDEAAGVMAEQDLDPSASLRGNREGWQELIKQQRKKDQEKGTNHADTMVGASPHFRRGLVRARANRLGMGLQTRLNQAWQENVDDVKSLDDPQAVEAWVQEQTSAYAEEMGVNQIDPMIQAEVFQPRAAQAVGKIVNRHMEYRAQARVGDYKGEFRSGVGLAVRVGDGASDAEAFIQRLGQRESSGNYGADNGEGYVGLLQFGKDRLSDYNKANGTDYTVSQLKSNSTIQDKVNRWHIADIDEEIAEAGYVEQGMSLDGLRAVAHLGGVGGMHQFASGEYDPDDSNGTRLSDYYREFSSTASSVMSMADEAIANGVSPSEVNEMTVDSLVEQAHATGNPEVLNVLDQINTGNGPLGNIAWVRKARREAVDDIEQRRIAEEDREYKLEQREREEARREITTNGFREIMSSPFANHDQLISDARSSGFPDLALRMYNLQEQLQDDNYDIRTNHEEVIALRTEIFRGEMSDEEVVNEIVQGTGTLWSSNVAQSLMDDLEKNSSGEADMIRDPEVLGVRNDMATVIRQNSEVKDMFGNIEVNGNSVAYRAESEFIDEMLVFMEENDGASTARVRRHARQVAREIMKRPEYQGNASQKGDSSSTGMTELDSAPENNSEASTDPEPEQSNSTGRRQQGRRGPTTAGRGNDTERDISEMPSPQKLEYLMNDPQTYLPSILDNEPKPADFALVNAAAASMGMSAQEFIEEFGGQ